jgi:hypothetical protein
MGCDYYINTVLKIVHKTGISCIRLSAEPVYLYGRAKDNEDDYTIHPSKRRPKIDHMKSECEDVLIYKKGEESRYQYMEDMDKYVILIDEYIKENVDFNYTSKNKIIIHNGLTSQNNPESGELLKDKNDIDEIYIIELRQWRP